MTEREKLVEIAKANIAAFKTDDHLAEWIADIMENSKGAKKLKEDLKDLDNLGFGESKTISITIDDWLEDDDTLYDDLEEYR